MTKKSTKRIKRPVSPRKKGQSAAKGATRLSKMAYQAIMDGIFSRRIAAGAYMSQNELVELLGVPIQPLRDALRVLEVEGLVKIHPRAGIEFSSLSPIEGTVAPDWPVDVISPTCEIEGSWVGPQPRSVVERRDRRHVVLVERVACDRHFVFAPFGHKCARNML